MSLTFPLHRNPNPAGDEAVAAVLVNPGFGDHFTDHMAVATWTKAGGWAADEVRPYGPFQMDPASAVLHYGQEIFEGMKAYRHADGSIHLFRPEANAKRFQSSAARMMLPELPTADFITAVEELVKADARWVPTSTGEQSLYIRPFMFASEVFLGVRAAETVTFCVIVSPAGPYFAGGVRPVDIWVTDEYARAGVGGTGAAKCGGNYAASLIAQYQGYEHGCSQVLFIEAADKDRVEELGGMNVFLVTSDGRLVTPALTGTILEGITRDSILTVAVELGLQPDERRITPDELFSGLADGTTVEAFSCGTAAVITPIGAFKSKAGEWRLPENGNPQALAIRNALLDIQYGRVPDTHGWLTRVV
ncbi:MAG TPA: branched-chain amino acid aminotransferase [Propionicimonas sp.]|nr:branched-chain amino acid aminotransferase [Propionicimonas sp.]HRA05086.1 branched-chain amino acid aminotransferase [Propionicimonas sp.]